VNGGKWRQLNHSYSLVTSPLFFHIVTVLVQALNTEYDEIFQALVVKRDVLLSKPLLNLSIDTAIRWESLISKASFSLPNT